MKMDKKADIPVTILVIGVLVVCSLALYTFLSSVKVVNEKFFGIDLIEEVNHLIEQNPQNPYYREKIDTGFDFNLAGRPWSKEKVIFSVDYTP
ncbi:hypothetical protein ACFLZJ_00115 [Nanoarchaeota archaeon]